jgi:hypothetical protein
MSAAIAPGDSEAGEKRGAPVGNELTTDWEH